MRLHRLRLQAFGPFADAIPTVVDFDALSSEGLFSISGPTGSGKSTLLDAICYALYGETTGGDRQPEDMRSQHAPADMKTFVELDFSLGTGPSRQNYRYRREPKQMVIKARGQGTTEKGGSVSLHRLDAQGREQESLATQIPASKEWTRNLLRLTVEQFRKVVVLPQGKFAEMLRTNSASEREKQLDLFDVLFNTGWASQTMEAIRETRKAGTAAAQKFEVQRQSILKQANCATEEELGELVRQSEIELKRAQNGEHRVRTHRLRREQLLQQGKKTAELLATRQMAQQDLEALRAELPQRTEEEAILKRAAAAARVAPALESLSKAREKSAEATRQREDAALQAKAADEALGKSRETAAQIPQWETQVEVARGKKTDSERWVGLFRTAAMAAEKAQEAQAAHEQAAAVAVEQQAQLDTLKSQQAKAQEDLTLRRQQADQVPLLTQQLAELTRHRKAAQRADTVARDLATAATAVDQATAARDKSRTARQDAEEVLSRRTEELLHSQAAYLAASLADGDPCPVCGSTHHPAPAISDQPDAPPSGHQLKAAQSALSKARDAEQEADAALAQATTRHAELAATRNELREGLGPWKDKATELEAEWQRMEKEVQSAQKAAQDAEQIRIQIEAQSAVLAEQDKRLKSALENRDALHLQSVAAQTTLADARKQLPPQIRDEQAANQLLQEASREFETLQNTIQTARQKLQDAEQQQAAHQSSFVAAEAALKSRLEEQQEALAHADSQLIAEGFVDPQGVPSLDAARSAWILPATLSQRQQAHDLWKTALDQAQDRANRAQLEAEGLTPPDLSLLQQWVTRTEALTQSMSRKVGEITREFQARTQSVQALTQLTTARQEAASRQNALEWLDDLFTDGSLSGGKRETLPNFRKYVLAECISAVVDRANLRFRRLSRGRYEVRQKVTTVLGGKKSAKAASAGGASGDLTSDPVTVPPITFLTPELMIHDTYLQQDRPVSTLSGGETFQLSMALALGLAETITEAQGGIQLDTVFIDEGFGTLDSESLDLAIGVLTDLRDTGRVVGVISHVEELHQRMSARVEVRKGPSGASQILVHTAG